MKTSTCLKCNTAKELSTENFHKDNKNASGFKHRCKICCNKARIKPSMPPPSPPKVEKVKVPVEEEKTLTTQHNKKLDHRVFDELSERFNGYYTISVSEKGTEIRKHGQHSEIWKGKTPREALCAM